MFNFFTSKILEFVLLGAVVSIHTIIQKDWIDYNIFKKKKILDTNIHIYYSEIRKHNMSSEKFLDIPRI